MEEDDNILLKQIQEDNQQALEILFKKYYSSLCHFAKTFVKRADLSEEVVADVFFKLWKNRKTIFIHSNLKAYLYIAIKNESLNALNKAEFTFEDIDFPEATHSIAETSTSTALEYEELREEIIQLINELPPQRKLIFKLNRIDGLKYKEIADVLHISVNTVQKQMVEAVKYLSKYESSYLSYQILLCVFIHYFS